MDGERFDALTRVLGTGGRSRRGAFRLLTGGLVAGGLSGLGPQEAAAACVAAGKKCRPGQRCCSGARCTGSRCACKPGRKRCGKVCRQCCTGADCPSGACRKGRCLPASCADGRRNGDETDVDCGGSCPPCADGKVCAGNGDCAGGHCCGGTCRACCGDGDCPRAETCGGGGTPDLCGCALRGCAHGDICVAPARTCQACSAQTADPACHVYDPANNSPAICGTNGGVAGHYCVCLTTPTGAACVATGGATCYSTQSTCMTDADCDQFHPGGDAVCVTGCAGAVGLNCGGNGSTCLLPCQA